MSTNVYLPRSITLLDDGLKRDRFVYIGWSYLTSNKLFVYWSMVNRYNLCYIFLHTCISFKLLRRMQFLNCICIHSFQYYGSCISTPMVRGSISFIHPMGMYRRYMDMYHFPWSYLYALIYLKAI